MSTAQLLYQPTDAALRFLPEGPYPFAEGKFSWVAIQHGSDSPCGSLNVFDFRSKTNQSFPLPGRPGFAFATNRGNVVIGCERSVILYSLDHGSISPIVEHVDAHTTGTIINDGVTWDGNLIFGTKDLEFRTKKAGLYLLRGKDKRLFRLRDDQICSNGKCILEKGETWVDLLDIDSPSKCVMRYRVNLESGTIESEKMVIDLRKDIAVPDGMTRTLDGKSVIISMYNPNPASYGRTLQIGIESGAIEYEWKTEASPQATCPQWFVDQGVLWLIITTAVEHMPADRQLESPMAGSLFAVPMGPISDLSTYRELTQPFIE
jgi:sugar lactone lactonase YvrE